MGSLIEAWDLFVEWFDGLFERPPTAKENPEGVWEHTIEALRRVGYFLAQLIGGVIGLALSLLWAAFIIAAFLGVALLSAECTQSYSEEDASAYSAAPNPGRSTLNSALPEPEKVAWR